MTAFLPIFEILGTDYSSKHSFTYFLENNKKHDAFTKIDFVYPDATATVKIGDGVKSEGKLTVSGTKVLCICSCTLVENKLF